MVLKLLMKSGRASYPSSRPRTLGFRRRVEWPARLPGIDFATSRVHSMKRATTGLSVRFLSVTTLTGHGWAGKSTGSTLSELKCTTDFGIAAMNWPLARKWVMTGMDNVSMPAFGMGRPRAWKTSARCW